MDLVFKELDKLLKKSDIIVLGCSGGPDSMALLSLLLKLKDKYDLQIILAHVNHKVRKESDEEYKWLSSYALKHHLIFEGMSIDNYSDDNFHNEARNIRYSFFEDIIKKYKANYLMTAHHGDDLMETVLMRIVRGSTLGGYAGFADVVLKDSYKIVRPLITVTKDDILSYDKENNIEYVVDKSNFADKYTRNRYRKNVLPFLKKEDINVHKKFLKYSKLLFMYDDYINKEMKKVINKVYKDGEILVDKFKKLDTLFQDKIIDSILEDIYHDDLILINDVHVKAINNLIYSKKANSYLYLPNNYKVIKSYNSVKFVKEIALIDNYDVGIDNSGYIYLPNDKAIEVVSSASSNSNFYARFCYDDIKLPIHVRTRKSGDKMNVKGLNGSKKVKDIFIDSKIPANERDLWPVVVDSGDNVIWIPGIKKSKFDIPNSKKCDIILWYH